jgi:alkanesulfonate monooxygenase SsuD/methylene tetrahydromethanopterin reductase-like flavin-dependent oxidoreductase (luciferase family)
MRKPFQFGVQAYRAEDGRSWRELARRVEDLGYKSLHTSDHNVGPGPAMEGTGHRPVTMAPIPAIAVAAEATTTLHIGCRMFCVSYHSPVVLAKEIATLACMAEGPIESASAPAGSRPSTTPWEFRTCRPAPGSRR